MTLASPSSGTDPVSANNVSSTTNITVFTPVVFSLSPSASSICQGESVTYTIEGGNTPTANATCMSSGTILAGNIINISSIINTISVGATVVGPGIPPNTLVVSTGVIGSQPTISTMTVSKNVTVIPNTRFHFAPLPVIVQQIEEGSKISFYDISCWIFTITL